MVTDHLALKWLNSIESPSGRITRWALELQQYSFDVQYRRGKLNVVADALSRDPVDVCQVVQAKPEECKWWRSKCKEVTQEPEKFPDFSIIEGQLYRHLPTADDDEECAPWKLCVPSFQRQRVLEENHDAPTAGHLGIRKTIARVTNHYYWPGMFRDIRRAMVDRLRRFCRSFAQVQTRELNDARLYRQVFEVV